MNSAKLITQTEDNENIHMMEHTQTKGLKRNTIDKFYTKPEIVDDCLKWVKKSFRIKSSELIIEPSAGNGSFIQGIKKLGTKNSSPTCLFYDLEPENSEIEKQDYLLFEYKSLVDAHSRIHIVGNPPFGRQSSLAIKFIKKSCEFADTVSFILPKSFKKDSMHKAFPLNFHLVKESDLPEKAFLLNDKDHKVPCVFQIWKKQKTFRKVKDKCAPTHFQFVKKEDTPDVSFRRVGGTAGKVDTNVEDKSIQSHYFIKFNDNIVCDDGLVTKLNQIEYASRLHTVGPRSISKPELIAEFNKVV